jgi:hypothetical protein
MISLEKNDRIRARVAWLLLSIVLVSGLWCLAVTETDAQTVDLHHVATSSGSVAIGVRVKQIPLGAITPVYTLEMRDVDLRLARMFGGEGALAAGSGFDLLGLGESYALYRGDLIGDNGMLCAGHLSWAIHLYGSEDGRVDTSVYVPAGFKRSSKEPGPVDGAVIFYYPRFGLLGSVTLVAFHVRDFELKREGSRVRIGWTGGRGGSAESYRHSHLEAYYGDVGLPSAEVRGQLRIKPSLLLETLYAAAMREVEIEKPVRILRRGRRGKGEREQRG